MSSNPEIKTVFDSSNRPGEFEKKIRVITNDPETPTTTLEIRGTVESGPSPAIEVTNRKIDFGVISLKSPHEFAISIRNTGKEDLIVSSIKNPRGEAFLNSEITIPMEGRKIIHLTYNPQKKGPEIKSGPLLFLGPWFFFSYFISFFFTFIFLSDFFSMIFLVTSSM